VGTATGVTFGATITCTQNATSERSNPLDIGAYELVGQLLGREQIE
jgi:hypothetical protein